MAPTADPSSFAAASTVRGWRVRRPPELPEPEPRKRYTREFRAPPAETDRALVDASFTV